MDAGVQVDPCDLAPLLNRSASSSSSASESPPPPSRLLRKKSQTYYPASRRYHPRQKAKVRMMLISVLFGVVLLVLVVALYCPGDLFPAYSRLGPKFSSKESTTELVPTFPTTIPVNFIPYEGIQDDNFEFNLSGRDVMVFLHIQKTGGTTFGKHLVQDIDLEEPCQCRRLKKRPKSRQYGAKTRVKRKIKCECFRPGEKGKYWLFSRYSTGWKCGLHPDWTELTACVDNY
eukprot:maker-scaffold1083_size63694-snap-gene-0.17 protein:Tk08595 transcript:maker-scaffold1083_size63694-snap-gene-0.17-mRNA-1 annotation:"heparan-sulfate 6-o-sulfotransferase 2"